MLLPFVQLRSILSRDLIGDALRGLGQWRAILRCSQPGADRRHFARPAFAGDDQRRAVCGVNWIEFGALPDGLRKRANVLDVLQQLLPTRVVWIILKLPAESLASF